MTAGKGDTYRKVDQQKYAENFDKIFRKVPKYANIHPRCSEPFCSCLERCVQMEPIDAGDLHK